MGSKKKASGARKIKRKSRMLGSHLIRVSDAVISYLKNRQHGKECIDATMRRQFGITARDGKEQKLNEFYVIDAQPPLVFTDEAQARGIAIQRAVQKELKWNKTERVIIAREVP